MIDDPAYKDALNSACNEALGCYKRGELNYLPALRRASQNWGVDYEDVKKELANRAKIKREARKTTTINWNLF